MSMKVEAGSLAVASGPFIVLQGKVKPSWPREESMTGTRLFSAATGSVSGSQLSARSTFRIQAQPRREPQVTAQSSHSGP